MEKRVWTSPKAVVEQFMPNEYIAACFYIACNYGANNMEVDDMEHTKNNNGSGCGHATNQAISVISGDIQTGATIGITELNVRIGNWRGELDCYFTTAGNAAPGSMTTTAKVGDTIYWVTDVDYRENFEKWMIHEGTIKLIDGSRPKHS